MKKFLGAVVAFRHDGHLRLVPNSVGNLDTTMGSPRQIWVTLHGRRTHGGGWREDVNIGIFACLSVLLEFAISCLLYLTKHVVK